MCFFKATAEGLGFTGAIYTHQLLFFCCRPSESNIYKHFMALDSLAPSSQIYAFYIDRAPWILGTVRFLH
jgi:hypothetical protein